MSTIELKPCPFCGSIALRHSSPGAPYVECLDCGTLGPGPDKYPPGVHRSLAEIAASADRTWNERA